jgi:hypothetical protein
LRLFLNSWKLQDTLRPGYRFDYAHSKPNRFAAKMSEGAVAVVLEPDVAAVFKSSRAVNTLLRSVISAMPEPINVKRADKGMQPTAQKTRRS